MTKTIRRFILVIVDIVSINLALLLSLLIKFDLGIPQNYIEYFPINSIIITTIQVSVFYIFGLYRSLWEYAGIDEAIQVFNATMAAEILSCVISLSLGNRFPYTIYIIAWILSCMISGGARLSYRLFRRASK